VRPPLKHALDSITTTTILLILLILSPAPMSHASLSYCLRTARWGTKFPNDLPLKDSLWETLTDSYCKMPMANTAEKLASQFGITRAQCDEFAVRSQVAATPSPFPATCLILSFPLFPCNPFSFLFSLSSLVIFCLFFVFPCLLSSLTAKRAES
jgi:hypothetical protein